MMSDLIVAENIVAIEIFTESGVEPLLGAIEKEISKFEPDASTAKGRKEIASMAHKIARSKTYLDGLGKALVADWKKQAQIVDDSRKRIRDRLDSLKAEVRQPLTEWEEAEEKRVQSHRSNLTSLADKAMVAGKSSKEIENVIFEVTSMEIDSSWEEFREQAFEVKDRVLGDLRKFFEERQTQEREQAELERLRAENIERQKREYEERIAKEAAEKARLDAEERARRVAEEKEREHQNAINAQRRAEERAMELEAEAKAREIRVAEEKKAAEERARHDAEMAVKRERERLEAARLREISEQRKREADLAHRKKVNVAAAEALVEFSGIDISQAKKVIIAIASNEVPSVSINY